jgi:hypothetical protein
MATWEVISEVQPLLFSESELDAVAFLSLMAVNSSDTADIEVQVTIPKLLSETISTTMHILGQSGTRNRTYIQEVCTVN